jgi:hypothetical protein
VSALIGDAEAVRARLDRLHALGFAVDELEFVTGPDGRSMHVVPKVVEHGYHRRQLAQLTGLQAGDNQARRMLQDIKSYHAWLRERSPDQNIPFNVAAVRWLDQVFEPVMAAIPPEMFERLQPAEIFHQLLEHRWYLAEESGSSQGLIDVLDGYLDLLRDAPQERRLADDTDVPDGTDPTGEIVIPPA